MNHRTTFALDGATAQRLKRLAARWRVSQAEVVRRSLEQAERLEKEAKADPVELLRRLAASIRRPVKWNAAISTTRAWMMVLDDLADLVADRGGEVVVIPAEGMAAKTGLAAVYRY